MTRLVSAVRLELTTSGPAEVPARWVFSGLMWLAVLLPMPHQRAPDRRALRARRRHHDHRLLLHRRLVFFEKQERTLGAVISTPLRFWEYLTAKLTVLLADFTCSSPDRGHALPTGSPTTCAVGRRCRARDAGDAAGRIHLARCRSPR